ncbi:hypothetical protein EUX98_g6863 [Antrodiella citrinella]|uniref:Uncharacterized protein n=1 Tax=Antrodiella citrinella TaxID=2447956 RepID=A0A4S4MVE5_9APHY|nr:hypothetical protein EUX98_g6863 [Antrodiella citrinella]
MTTAISFLTLIDISCCMTDGNKPTSPITLSEEYVQDCFHSYLKSSLTQAKAERLLDIDVLASAEGDLMITGPALCLYFAALRSTTYPPSVPLPRLSKSGTAPTDLSLSNCPPAFRPFLIVWSNTVLDIQALAPEYQHDLARIICSLSPVAQPLNPRLNGIAADLRAVAIEISMRRTFQDRYANDLQAALDAGNSTSLRVKASFVPPPTYDDAPSSPALSVRTSSSTLSPLPSGKSFSSSSSTSPSSKSFSPIPPSPSSPGRSILTEDSPAIEFIRETLYAALGDVLERVPALRRLLRRDPGRAYFASVAFAILDVASYSTYHENGDPAIRGVMGTPLRLSMCPPELKPFMVELCAIGEAVKEIDNEDSLASVDAMRHGKDLPIPRMDRVRDILEGGVGHAYNRRSSRPQHHGHGHSHSHSASSNGSARGSNGSARGSDEYDPLDTRATDPRRRTTSTEGRAVAFANRINALALGMTRLRAFRERQEAVFKVLIGVGGGT